jgi:hypothetical protein
LNPGPTNEDIVTPPYLVRWFEADAQSLLDADETAWNAPETLAWGADPFRTACRLLGTVEALYVRFDVSDVAPWHTLTVRDDHLWNEEVVEIFIDPLLTGRDYVEIEINPANTVCDLIVRHPWPALDSDPSWHFPGLDTRVRPWRAAGSGPDGWTAVARLPWTGFAGVSPALVLPPAPGDAWRFNVFRIKRPHGPSRPDQDVVYAAWSPTGGPSFHVPGAFRPCVFAAR